MIQPFISTVFLINRGCSTAWKQIHAEVLSSPNIYEFDLRKYFDSINLDYLTDILLRTQLPHSLVKQLILWSRTPPKNTTESIHTWQSVSEEAADYKYHETGIYPDTWSDSDNLDWLCHKRVAELTTPCLQRYDYFHGVAKAVPPLL